MERRAISTRVRGKHMVLGLAALVLSAIGAGSLFLSPLAAQSCGYGYGGYGCTGEPASIALFPRDATNPVGTQHCVDARVEDALGTPVGGVSVSFSVVGTLDGAVQSTDVNGETVFCYSGPGSPRTDTISATVQNGPSATGPYLENPASCPPAGLGYTLAFRYQNGEALNLSPVVSCAGAQGTASANSQSGQHQEVTVSQTSTSGATAARISTLLSRPGDPATPVSPTTGLDIGLPAGMVRNFASFPTCARASLEQRGPRGCPGASRVGTGTLTIDIRPVLDERINGLAYLMNGEGGRLLLWVLPDVGPIMIVEGVPNPSGVLVFVMPRILVLPGIDGTLTALDLNIGATGAGGTLSDSVIKRWVGGSAPSPPPVVQSVLGAPPIAPRVVLGGASTQKFTGAIAVSAECAQACQVLGSASVSVPKASKVFKSKRIKRNLAAGQRVKLKLTFPKKAARAIRRAVRRKRLTATVSVTTRGVGANASKTSTSKRKIKLRG